MEPELGSFSSHQTASLCYSQPPISNDRACACLIGLKTKTSSSHIVRAVHESLAFRCKLIYDEMLREIRTVSGQCVRYGASSPIFGSDRGECETWLDHSEVGGTTNFEQLKFMRAIQLTSSP